MNSIILIDKPPGITSFDVIQFIRKRFKEKRVGHAGVLDKMATGLLICATGKATKLLNIFENSDKTYIAELTFGIETNTYDITGKITNTYQINITREKLLDTLKNFEGTIDQTPPPFSNIKYQGKRLYKYALKGENVKIQPRKITIKRIELLSFNDNKAIIKVSCSKGTYIRSLANDIGKLLGCGAVVSSLRRIYTYPFQVDSNCSLEKPCVLSLEEAFYFLDPIVVNEQHYLKIRNGINPCFIFNCDELNNKLYKIVNESNKIIAIIEKKGNSYSYKAILN